MHTLYGSLFEESKGHRRGYILYMEAYLKRARGHKGDTYLIWKPYLERARATKGYP